LAGGIRWGSGAKPGRFGTKERERQKERETFLSIVKTEKSSEGRTPRASGAEKGFQGLRKADTAARVAKPCGWHFRDAWQRVSDVPSSEGAKKRAPQPAMLKGRKAQARRFLTWALISRPEPGDEGRQGLGVRRYKVASKCMRGWIRWKYLPELPVAEDPRVRAER
jgi:hypothetical protein